MKKPIIGFAGLTHLGLNSAVASAERGFQVIGFHDDVQLVENLTKGVPHVSEPQLQEFMDANKERLEFSSDKTCLGRCDIVYISVDVPTDDKGMSNLAPVEEIIHLATAQMRNDAILVILCQVPPGFTRKLNWPPSQLVYQVETLIFGRAVDRALNPERFIIGLAAPQTGLPAELSVYLEAFECPILPMKYESAELAKISINMFLVASVTTSNTLAELCEQIGANWSEIIPALRLDKRIGTHAYLKPGLGIAGGNLERDLRTVLNFSSEFQTDAGIVSAWINNSTHRKNWAAQKLEELVLKNNPGARIGILGLTYKENTHSLKNSASIELISKIKSSSVFAYDPAAPQLPAVVGNIHRVNGMQDVLDDADVLLVMTPWDQFRSLSTEEITSRMKGKVVIDPYQILDGDVLVSKGFTYATLGKSVHKN